MIDSLRNRMPLLTLQDILSTCVHHSRSQLYKWHQKAIEDRKARGIKVLDEKVIENAAAVTSAFPYMGGRKAQAFMLYHNLGFIGTKAYDRLKKQVQRVLRQEVSGRDDLPTGSRGDYEHIQPERIGQIWAEDFTEIMLEGIRFKIALLIDMFSQYILGWNLAYRATDSFVAAPVIQALKANGNKPPELFLLQDNGKQYVSENHARLLEAHEIVGRHIPPGVPQYNGAVECGGKEFKNLFYNVWERLERQGTDKEKKLKDRVWNAAAETVKMLNRDIPRPALKGVTPEDMQHGINRRREDEINQYLKMELAKGPPPALSRPYWEILKNGVKATEMSTKELLTKLAFYGKRPLRRIAQLNRGCVG